MKHLPLVVLLSAFGAHAGTVTSKIVQDRKYSPLDNSALSEFRVKVSEYKVTFTNGEISYGSKMIASYKTKDIRDLEDYVVVQYIKGCKYESVKINGNERNEYTVSREFFGDVVPFIHKEWVVDSVDEDPVYNSTNESRHALYRWNSVMDSEAKETERYYFQAPPENNRLYVRDMPGTSFMTKYPQYNAIFATNTSLKFKTCLFRTENVPMTVSSPSEDLTDKAIKCYDWSSSFVYNSEKKKFESPKEIVPACL